MFGICWFPNFWFGNWQIFGNWCWGVLSLWGFELSIISSTALVGGNRKPGNTSGHINIWTWASQISCCHLMQRRNPRRSCHPAPGWAAEPPAPRERAWCPVCCLTRAELCLLPLWALGETGTFLSIHSLAWAGLTMQIWQLDFSVNIMYRLNLKRILQGVSWAQQKFLQKMSSKYFLTENVREFVFMSFNHHFQ